ncbi:hypothetical protein BEN42_15640 [Leptospira interrogans serovar Canicola]|nr:hypothetical protein [Leptospira interrogans serovar Canicola]OQM26732.1 hypothetical protein DV30_21615 [Leptospira interrogans serovar Canicola str. Gui44]
MPRTPLFSLLFCKVNLAMIQYQIEWFYLEEYFGKVSDSREPLDAEKEIHCSFLLRFPDIPKGEEGPVLFSP